MASTETHKIIYHLHHRQRERETERSQNAAENIKADIKRENVRWWKKCRKSTLSRKTQMPDASAVSMYSDR